jgi:hypothetical protein
MASRFRDDFGEGALEGDAFAILSGAALRSRYSVNGLNHRNKPGQ